MGAKIVLCHYTEGGHWDSIEISTNALNGHDNHSYDIWPAVPDVTPGQNWPQGEEIYLNGCVMELRPEPSPSPSPSPTDGLPGTGSDVMMMLLIVLGVLAIGVVVTLLTGRRRR